MDFSLGCRSVENILCFVAMPFNVYLCVQLVFL